MSTRGYLKAGKDYYFIGSDAYPSFVRPVLQKALRRCKDGTYNCVIREANRIAEFKWIDVNEPVDKEWRMGIFCSYGWEIFPKSKKVKLKQKLIHRKVGGKIKFYQKIGGKTIYIKDKDLNADMVKMLKL